MGPKSKMEAFQPSTSGPKSPCRETGQDPVQGNEVQGDQVVKVHEATKAVLEAVNSHPEAIHCAEMTSIEAAEEQSTPKSHFWSKVHFLENPEKSG